MPPSSETDKGGCLLRHPRFQWNLYSAIWNLRLCHRKRLMPFSMAFQGNNQQNASAMKPAKGKTGEKAVFSPYCRDETTTYYDRAKFKMNLLENHWKGECLCMDTLLRGCVIKNGWCFFPWSCKEITNKIPLLWIQPRGNWRKRLHFHRAVEIRQPHAMTDPFLKVPKEQPAKCLSHRFRQRRN